MRYANTGSDKTEAAPNVLFATCPCCNEDVIPKCGNIKAWHFAHKAKSDCKYKPMTEWHYEWQSNFNKDFLEVIQKDRNTGEKHIADVKNSAGVVIEFQHSSISHEEVESRENFYKKMVWVLDGSIFKVDSDKNIKIGNFVQYWDIEKEINKLQSADNIEHIYSTYKDWFLFYGIKNIEILKKMLLTSIRYKNSNIVDISKMVEKFNGHIFIDNLDGTMWYIEPNVMDFYISNFNSSLDHFLVATNAFQGEVGYKLMEMYKGGRCKHPWIQVGNKFWTNCNFTFSFFKNRKFKRMRFASLVSKESFIKKYNQ